MFVKQNKSHKGIFLTYTIGYRENGKVKHKNIETIGYLDDLKKLYEDPLSHFKEIAKQRSNNDINELIIKNLKTKIINEDSRTKNLGYVILKRVYDELCISSVLNTMQSSLNINYSLDAVMKLLVFSRILYPASKNETFNNKDIFFDDFDFSLKDLYRSLDHFESLKKDIIKTIWNHTKESFNRDTSISYYDTTNYYFEISYNDEDLIDENGTILEKGIRKKGPSKEHRKTPIIGMGLLMDNAGIPLSYDLFPGNESEKLMMRPSLNKTKSQFGIDRTIIVADRGQNTSDNLFYVAGKNDDKHTNHDGYVYGQSIIGADKEFKTWALDPEGFQNDYVYDDDGNIITYKEEIKDKDGNLLGYEDKPVIFKHKSRVYAKTIQIERDSKRKNKVIVYQKQMVYYSKKYADRQKHERENAVKKAKDLIENPGKYTQATSYGCTKYINNIKFSEETGEIPDGLKLSLKKDKINEEEKYYGYYSIVTSEKNLTDKEIRDIYKGLWKIEESFKITKSNLETRPIYVWTKEHIEALKKYGKCEIHRDSFIKNFASEMPNANQDI